MSSSLEKTLNPVGPEGRAWQRPLWVTVNYELGLKNMHVCMNTVIWKEVVIKAQLLPCTLPVIMRKLCTLLTYIRLHDEPLVGFSQFLTHEFLLKFLSPPLSC